MNILNKLLLCALLLGVGYYAGQYEAQTVQVAKVEPVAMRQTHAEPVIPLETRRTISVEDACILLNQETLQSCANEYRARLSTASAE